MGYDAAMEPEAAAARTQSLTPLQGEILRRLARIKGQVGGVQRMIAEGEYCVDVLTQIHAARSALDSVAGELMRNHLETCCVEAIRSDDEGAAQHKIEEFGEVVKRFVR